jgi:hypothetical protein
MIEKMTGEQLCEIQAREFNKLMVAQSNLQAIEKELERRKAVKAEVVDAEPVAG